MCRGVCTAKPGEATLEVKQRDWVPGPLKVGHHVAHHLHTFLHNNTHQTPFHEDIYEDNIGQHPTWGASAVIVLFLLASTQRLLQIDPFGWAA